MAACHLYCCCIVLHGYRGLLAREHEFAFACGHISTVGHCDRFCGRRLGVFFPPRAERFIIPTLDLLQTIPAFAYLLPILLLFGFGPVVGLIASVLFAFPPMVAQHHAGTTRCLRLR